MIMPRTDDDRPRGSAAEGLAVPVLSGLARRLARVATLAIRARDGRLLLRTPSSRADQTMEIPTVPLSAPTLGDLLVAKGRAWIRVSPGSDGYVLTASSSAAAGVTWAASSGGGGGGSSLDPFGRLWVVEDWIGRTTEDGEWGMLGWSSTAISSGTQSLQPVSTGTGWREAGVMRLGGGSSGASASNPRGRVHYLGEDNASGITPLYGQPGEGVYFACKVRISSSTLNQQTVWTGVWEKSKTWPDPAGSNSNSGIGVRVSSNSATTLGNWLGVVRNGSTETTVDLGVLADANWRTIGWRATATGIQFIVRSSGAWVDTGGEIPWANSAMPSTSTELAPVIAATGHSISARTADFDTWALWADDLERGA